MCNTTCSIRASSSSASYELNSGNYLTCHRNVITFTVSNNTGTALPRNDIYLINIEVGNSAGTGYSVGEISLSEFDYSTAQLLHCYHHCIVG